MPQCCRCNASGRCNNCVCAKAKKPCIDCLPGKKTRCSNRSVTTCSQPLMTATCTAHIASTFSTQPSTASPVSAPPRLDAVIQPPHGPLPPPQGDVNPLLGELPGFVTTPRPVFVWGSCNSESFMNALHSAYTEVVHWRPNLFRLPQGNAGKSLVSELARLYGAFASESGLSQLL